MLFTLLLRSLAKNLPNANFYQVPKVRIRQEPSVYILNALFNKKTTQPKSCYTEYKHTSLIEKLPFTTFSINHHHKWTQACFLQIFFLFPFFRLKIEENLLHWALTIDSVKSMPYTFQHSWLNNLIFSQALNFCLNLNMRSQGWI